MPRIGEKHKTSHQDGGDDEISLSGLSGVVSFVDGGDPELPHFTHATLTIDNTWHDLDLSAIIPEGTKAVVLFIIIKYPNVTSGLYLRKKGSVNYENIAYLYCRIANTWEYHDVIVAVDENRKIEYAFITGLVGAYITVKGSLM